MKRDQREEETIGRRFRRGQEARADRDRACAFLSVGRTMENHD